MLTYTIEPKASNAKKGYLQEAMHEVFGPNWDVNPDRPSEFQMVIKSVPFGKVNLSQTTLSQAMVTNCEKVSRRTPERPYHIYILNRRQKIVTNDRTVILEPGDFTLADSAMATSLITKEPYTTIGLTVPARILQKYIPDPESAVGARFSGKTGFSKIVSYMLLSMWEHAESGKLMDFGDDLVDSLLGIVSACCRINNIQPDEENAQIVEKRDKIKQVINQNLHNPELCVGELAREFGFSIRYVQRLFSEEECTVSKYIRRQRLEGCKKQLADPAWLNHSITEIAFNWGFNSSAHFARVFKEQYGINAREYRKQALKGLSYYKDAGS